MPKINTKQNVAVLDLGTNTICASIVKAEAKGRDETIATGCILRVLGVGYQATKGMKRGSIVNFEEFEDTIISAIQAAEKEAQKTIKSVCVAMPTWAVSSHIVSNSMEIGQLPVDDVHVKSLIKFDVKKHTDASMEVMHVFPIAYSVDDNHGILDPIGMIGKTLSADFHVMLIPSAFAKNIRNCLARNNIEVEEFICSTYAAGLSVLLEDEIMSGVTLIDIGGSTTSVCSFIEGLPMYLDTLPVGGQSITDDVATVLRATKSNSERLKILYGVSPEDASNENEQILVPKIDDYGEEHVQNVSKAMLSSIVVARLEEILELVQKRIQESELDKCLYQRIVITGGGSRISGLSELIKFNQYFSGLSVRLGKTIDTVGSHDFVQTASFATSAGAALYRLGAFQNSVAMKLTNDKRSLWQMLVSWFKRGI